MEMQVLDTRPVKYTALWVIQDLKSWSLNNSALLRGPRLSVSDKAEWDLDLEQDPVSLNPKVTLVTCKSTPLKFHLKLSIIDAKFQETHQQNKYSSAERRGSSFAFTQYLPLKQILEDKNILIEGDLVLLLEITVFQFVSKLYKASLNVSKIQVEESMKALLVDGNFSDFKITVGTKEFKCHKCILSCRSEVFGATITHDLEENKKNEIVLTDVEPSILEKLLTYIYTGDVDISNRDAMPLSVVANKYCLEKLMILCAEKIRSRLNLEDTFQMYNFSDMHNLKVLKNDVDRIIKVFSKQLKIRGVSSVGPSFPENNLKPVKILGEKSVIPNAKVWYHTRIQNFGTIIWRINNFQMCFGEENASVRSSDFYMGKSTSQEVSCKVEAFVSTDKKDLSKKYLSFKISSLVYKMEYECVSLRISILDTNKKENGEFNTVVDFQSNDCHKVDNFMLIDDIIRNDELLHDGTLLLCFHFMVRKTFQLDSEEKTSDTTSDLTDDLSTLLSCSSCSDLVVKVDTAEFKCHKAILAVRSTFFETELSKRPDLKIMEISDITPETFTKILDYIYCGKLDIFDDSPREFLPVVLRFGLEELRHVIEEEMAESLAIFDAPQTVAYADLDGTHLLRGKDSGFVVV